MKYILYLIIACSLFLAFGCELEEYEENPVFSGPYLGQTLPDTVPLLFCDELFGQNKSEFGLIFSQDGKEIFYSRLVGFEGQFVLVNMKMQDDGTWTQPKVFLAWNECNQANPHYAFNDTRLYFSSRRRGADTTKDDVSYLDIWYTDRTEDGGWAAPVNVGSPVNLDYYRDDYAHVHDNILYFQSDRKVYNSKRDKDMYCVDIVDGKYVNMRSLGDSINSNVYEESNLFITQDDVMFFTSERTGVQDIYYSKQDEHGVWRKAKKLGGSFNSNFMEGQSKVTPDNQYFYFSTRNGAVRANYWVKLEYVYSLLEY